MDTVDFSTSYEPMDIDMSAHSNSEMDISYMSNDTINTPDINVEKAQRTDTKIEPALAPSADTTHQPTVTNIKKFHIKIQKETNPPNLKVKLICSVFILFLSIISYKVLNIQCSSDINTDDLKSTLSSKLYGQSRAIYSLIEALNVEEKHKLLLLYGGTGVGKTYTASLILDHVGLYSNMYHYTMPSFMETFTTDFMIGLTICKHTVLIVDDLNTNDMHVKTHIKDLVTKSQHLNKNVTIILIFNCDALETQCDMTFTNKLLHNFNHIDVFKMLIKFEPLKEEHLRKCIENELGNRKLNNIEFEKISKNFNVTLDGCKGVYTKMKVLDIL